jgi:hypothetical protein
MGRFVRYLEDFSFLHCEIDRVREEAVNSYRSWTLFHASECQRVCNCLCFRCNHWKQE